MPRKPLSWHVDAAGSLALRAAAPATTAASSSRPAQGQAGARMAAEVGAGRRWHQVGAPTLADAGGGRGRR